MKVLEDKSLLLKARIALHGNEDKLRHEHRSCRAMCSKVGMRINLSTASLFGWPLSKIDVKTACLQTEQPERDVFETNPRESDDGGKALWLLLTTAYGLINTNEKLKLLSDEMLTDLAFVQDPLLRQVFMIINDNRVVTIIAKIDDDLLLTGIPSITTKNIKSINDRFTLHTITHGPGVARYFG